MLKNTFIICVMAFLIACNGGDVNKNSLVIPQTYVSANYTTNTIAEQGLIRQMQEILTYLKKGENPTFKLRLDSLQKYFSANGIPSLKSVTGSYYTNLIETSFFPALVSSSQNTYDPVNGATATVGGVYAGRLLDTRGKETLQEAEKGLFAAALYNHFVSLANSNITEATIDQMICVYGASPSFPNTNTLGKTSTPDAYIALYAARRDKNDGAGLYTKIRDQFLKLQAALKAGGNYTREKTESLAELKYLLEKALMATVVNYCNSAIGKLSTTSAPATTLSGGLHELSECIGFVHGFKAVPQSERLISDAEIEEILTGLLSPTTADASMYKFITNGPAELPKITQIIQKIKNIYSFTDSEMEEFKSNWISVQGR